MRQRIHRDHPMDVEFYRCALKLTEAARLEAIITER